MENDPIQLRLTIRLLENRIQNLEHENSFLKTELSRMMGCETSAKRICSDENRAKWKYYHDHKDRVALEMGRQLGVPPDTISWTCIKRQTDDAYKKTNKELFSNA